MREVHLYFIHAMQIRIVCTSLQYGHGFMVREVTVKETNNEPGERRADKPTSIELQAVQTFISIPLLEFERSILVGLNI